MGDALTPDEVQAAIDARKAQAPTAVAAHIGGEDTYISPDQMKRNAPIAEAIDPALAEQAHGAEIRRQRNSGFGAGLKALAGGGISGLTAGIIDPFQEAQEFNRGLATVGTIGGAIIPGLFGDEAGIATAIAKDGAATERVGGALSSKFLYSGEVAGGKAGAGLERALVGASEHAERVKAVTSLPEDLSALDAAGLRRAEAEEIGRLGETSKANQLAAKSAVVEDVKAYQAQLKEANPFLVTSEGSASAPFAKSTKTLRNAFDNEDALRRNPGKLLDALERQGQAIEQTIGERQAIAAKFEKVNGTIARDLEEDLATLPDAATHVDLTGKAAKRYGAYADVKVGKEGVSVARADAEEFLGALKRGEVSGAGQQALAQMSGVLEANKALRAKIAASLEKVEAGSLTSDRLTAIRGARDALATPQAKSLGEEMLGGTIMGHVAGAFAGMPIIGPMIGAKAGKVASDLVFGRLGKVATGAAERTKSALSSFLDVAKRATPTLPVAAARVLADTAFAPSAPRSKEAAPGKGDELHAAFKRRTDEIKSQTMYAPDGSVQIRPEARQGISDRLLALRTGSPELADRLESIAVRRLEYLSSIIPRRPDIEGIPLGSDHWRPSDLQMRSFARSVAAVEDPHGVEERLASGCITPEEAACYHAVYPERAEALKQEIITNLPSLRKSLPYERRLALSIFSGVAVDPSLDPRILRRLQSQFAAEEGTNGGTMAPRPQPQFGSVRADIGTPSQERESRMR